MNVSICSTKSFFSAHQSGFVSFLENFEPNFHFESSFFSTDGTTIKSVSENVVTNPGDDATLSCNVEGKPLTEEHVRWERLGYDLGAKTKVTFVNGTSYLHIKNARREDVGNFRCVADNRVANPTSRDVLLIVKCKFISHLKKKEQKNKQ